MHGNHTHRLPRVSERYPETVHGLISQWTVNLHGDVDGFRLDTGFIVRFPPHHGNDVAEIVEDGAPVTVVGSWHVTPHGEEHISASSIESSGVRISVDVAGVSLHRRRIASNHPIRIGDLNGDQRQINILLNRLEARLNHIEEELRELSLRTRVTDDGG